MPLAITKYGSIKRIYLNDGDVKSYSLKDRNENSASNSDVRFSLKKPVEETKNLVALQNLTKDKLEKTLALGGFPMPSIAITKAGIPHTNFGNITLTDSALRNTRGDYENKANGYTYSFG